jgi:CDP-paratose 2-epimerase
MKAASAPRAHRPPPRVVITGGCGFIGCNLANALAERGDEVLVFDSLARRGAQENAGWLKERWRDRVTVVTGDVRDRSALWRELRNAKAVLHLASQVAVTTSLEDPLEDFAVNAQGSLNVLEGVRRHSPAAPVIFASTNKVYGKVIGEDQLARRGQRYEPCDEHLRRGLAEDSPLDFYSPYGCSKGAADQYVRDYARVFGLRTVVLRMSCIYGTRQFGTEDQGWLAHFLLRAVHDEPIVIYGDGYQVRDALFVDDAVAAWLGALDRIDAVSGRIFNLGGGPANTTSLLEAIELIAEIRGRSPQLKFASWRPGDQPWYVSDTRAISAALDWCPRTSLDRGLRKLHHWIRERFCESERPRAPRHLHRADLAVSR